MRPGDRFGTMRVERISETEVVLHDGNGRVRVPRFAGIERKTVIDPVHCAPTRLSNPPNTQQPKRQPVRRLLPRPRRLCQSTRPVIVLAQSPRQRAGAPCEDRPS
jgi:hypothetical protein